MPRTTGAYEITDVAGEPIRAFLPHPLPPSRPKLKISGEIGDRFRSADAALSRLDSAGRMVPSLDWFVYSFVRKEAVISSQIEGTQASLTDLLTAEAEAPTSAPPEDVEEICNYLEALAYAREQLRQPKGLPLSVRLLNGAHRRLLAGSRGQHKDPGRVRRSQNWIGGTRPGNARFVPPPPHRVPDLLADLEHFLHDDRTVPPLVRAGLAHVQFETIHPYLDGNGRVGRLLIALCLENWGLLAEPLLYLSHFFKTHRQEYYDLLGAVRTDGDWEGWLVFFLEGVAVVSDEAVGLIGQLLALLERDRRRYLDSNHASVMGARLFEHLARHPVITVKSALRLCDTTRPTAAKAVDSLCDAGVLEETSGRRRDRTFTYRPYLDLLRTGTDLA